MNHHIHYEDESWTQQLSLMYPHTRITTIYIHNQLRDEFPSEPVITILAPNVTVITGQNYKASDGSGTTDRIL